MRILMMQQGFLVLTMWMFLSVVAASGEEVKLALESEKKLQNIEYRAPNLFPESFDWDPRHTRFLVGSSILGKLVAVNEKGEVEEFVQDEEYAGAAILGVKVDSANNRVLAVVHSFKEPPLSALVAYDLTSKKRLLYVNLNEAQEPAAVSKGVANDVAVDDEANAFVTNTADNTVWKVTSSGNASVLVELPQQPVIVDVEVAKDIGANGIAFYEGCLIIGQTNSGSLFRVNLADNKVHVVRMMEGVFLPGADGLAFRSDGSLVVISTHTAWLLTSRDLWRSASLIDKVPLDQTVFTTSAAIDDMRVFTLHSHFPESSKGVDRDSFTIQEIEFPSDSNNNPLWLLAILGMFGVLVLVWKFQLNQFNKAYNKKRI